MASSTSKLPIDFDLYNADEEQVLYITDDVAGQTLTLEITNTSEEPVSLRQLSGSTSQDDHHFELVFRPGTVFNNPAAIQLLSAPFSMFMNMSNGIIQPNADGTVSIYFKSDGPMTLQPGDKLTILIGQIRADAGGGTRGTRVQLKYKNLLHAGSSEPFFGYREMPFSIVNHRGKRNIPLHVGFVGHNQVLNDGITPNSLRLRITNSSRKDVAIGADANSKLVLTFDSGPASDEWTLAMEGQVGGIKVQYRYSGTKDLFDANTAPVWEIPFTRLEKGRFIDVIITNIVTGHQAGHANLYLHYENIPGYWDGEMIAVIEKAPLCFYQNNVGIGTNKPNSKLVVNGEMKAVNANDSITISNREIFFSDNGQIRSLDDNHRIIFDRANDIMEFREYGKILFSPGATSGARTSKVAISAEGSVTATSFVGPGAAVRGMIVMWSGAINAVPDTWALCDGQNGTPDLRNRFIVGAGQNYTIGATGGLDTVKLEVAQMPSHNHAGSTSSDGNHQHWIEGESADGLAHRQRTIPGYTTVDMGFGGGQNSDPNDKRWRGHVNTDYQGQHAHSFTTSTVGGNAPHENRPPYYALAFIMKL